MIGLLGEGANYLQQICNSWGFLLFIPPTYFIVGYLLIGKRRFKYLPTLLMLPFKPFIKEVRGDNDITP